MRAGPLLLVAFLALWGCNQKEAAETKPAEVRAPSPAPRSIRRGPAVAAAADGPGVQPTSAGNSNLVIDGEPESANGYDAAMQLPTVPYVKYVEPDIKVNGRFRDTRLGTLEIEAVCSIQEDGLRCWTADGKPNADLTAKLNSNLRQAQKGKWANSNPTASIIIGKKNRIVVVRHIAPEDRLDSREWFSVQYAGNYRQSAATNLFLRPGMPQEEIMLLATEEPGTKETTVRITQTRAVPPAKLKLEEGATTTFGGAKFAIDSVDVQDRGSGQIAALTVRIRREPTDSTMSVSVLVRDRNESPVTGVDSQGKPATGSPHGVSGPSTPVYVANGSLGKGEDSLKCIVYVDRSEVGHLELRGFRSTEIDITGISMDPKG